MICHIRLLVVATYLGNKASSISGLKYHKQMNIYQSTIHTIFMLIMIDTDLADFEC